MVDIALLHRPALAAARSGHFGNLTEAGPAVMLAALPEGHVLQVLYANGGTHSAAPLAEISDGEAHAVRIAGPGQWLVVGDGPVSSADLARHRATLGAQASIVDQSHGRVRIGIAGAPVRDVLAKGTAVDLDPTVFAIGQSAMTLIGHIAVHLTRTGEALYEILVLRGFAESLWEDLIQMGLEYGVSATATA